MTGRLGLRWRIILYVALIEAVVLALSTAVIVENARIAISREVAANRDLARDYVIAAVGSLLRGNDAPQVMAFLPARLAQPRHVRLTIVDHATGLVHQPQPNAPRPGDEVPTWFTALLAPPVEQIVLPVATQGRVVGNVVIVPAPEDEIAEVWEDFHALALIAALACISLLLALSWAVARALAPLGRLTAAFARLEAGDFTTRVGSVGPPDLAPLALRFDALAEQLAHSLAEKDALNRKLVQVQDCERRAIAMELHDEFGPCLFGVRVEADSILRIADRLPGGDRALLVERAHSILAIAEQIQAANRDLLRRLRPMEIGQLPLPQVLANLLARLTRRSDHIAWHIDIADDLGSLDETTQLTLYRWVQEGVTNILRHADATSVDLCLRRRPGWIELRLTDNGRGLPPGPPPGHGLGAMRERAITLGGRFSATGGPGQGTMILAALPVPDIPPPLDLSPAQGGVAPELQAAL